MSMTSGKRAVSIVSLGLLFLSTSVRASLEKPVLRSRPVQLVAMKTLMVASWYGQKFQGRKTASGEKFDLNKLTAAHKTLPLGSLVRLKIRSTGRSVIVRINDRGPWIKGRDFDLSEAAAWQLGMHKRGIAQIEATIIQSDHPTPAGASHR